MKPTDKREIKFRALERSTNTWKYGFYVERIGYSYGMIYDEMGVGYKVKKESLGQYTSLKDKNGFEIYEGDILSWGTDKYLVCWDNTNSGFRAVWLKNITVSHVPAPDFEIIGNRYSNPELLNSK